MNSPALATQSQIQPVEIPPSVSSDLRLKDADLRVLNALVFFCGTRNNTAVGNERLAEHVGKTARSVRESLRRLREFGYIIRVTDFKPKTQRVIYLAWKKTRSRRHVFSREGGSVFPPVKRQETKAYCSTRAEVSGCSESQTPMPVVRPAPDLVTMKERFNVGSSAPARPKTSDSKRKPTKQQAFVAPGGGPGEPKPKFTHAAFMKAAKLIVDPKLCGTQLKDTVDVAGGMLVELCDEPQNLLGWYKMLWEMRRDGRDPEILGLVLDDVIGSIDSGRARDPGALLYENVRRRWAEVALQQELEEDQEGEPRSAWEARRMAGKAKPS